MHAKQNWYETQKEKDPFAFLTKIMNKTEASKFDHEVSCYHDNKTDHGAYQTTMADQLPDV